MENTNDLPVVVAPSTTITSLADYIRDLSKQDLVRVAIAGAVFAAGSSLLFAAWGSLSTFAKRRLMVTLEVPSRDDSYGYLVSWLNEHEYSKRASQLLVQTTYDPKDRERPPQLLFTPAIGTHWITYKGKWIRLERVREESPDIALASFVTGCVGGKHETITLSAFGWDRSIFKHMIEEAMELTLHREKGKLVLYTVVRGDWRKFSDSEDPRSLQSIFLQKTMREEIIEDIAAFLNTRQWYKSTGIPYRRGYLFYGPPGCGKSSFIKALAGHFGFGICLVNLNNRDITDETLTILLNESPRRCIVVIEDIDAAVRTRDNGVQVTTGSQNSQLTLSGLLNAIDGIASGEGRLLFLTTNKRQLLDEALVRPGRVDKKFYFDLAHSDQIERFFRGFYPGVSDDLVIEFVRRVPSKTYSMAELQKYLMFYRENSKGAVVDAERIMEIVSDGERKAVSILHPSPSKDA